MNENIYLPHIMVIDKITVEAPGVKTFRLKFQNEEEAKARYAYLQKLVTLYGSEE